MKITFEGVTRELKLHGTLKQNQAIQEYTGLPVLTWSERVSGFDPADTAGMEADPAAALRRSPMYTDPEWIKSVAAAHWLMLTQAGEGPPPLDDDYDCEVIDFYLAFISAAVDEVKAKRAPDKPDPTAQRARRAPSSRLTTAPKRSKALAPMPGALPRTGS